MPNSFAQQLIRTLNSAQFRGECPHCGESFRLREAGLFHLDEFTDDAQKLYQQRQSELGELRRQLRAEPERIVTTSNRGAERVNIGAILERLAPSLDEFPFDRNDCRSLFDPIDYVIFHGLSKGGTVSHVSFVEIKSGGSRLSARQKNIQDVVETGRVEFDSY